MVPAPLARTAGVLSLLAGALHGIVTPDHFDEWWGYGLFFMAAGAAQILFGLALLLDAINAKEFGPGWRRARRRLYLGGIIGNLAIIGVYIASRTVGIPVGPDAGELEPVGLLDVVSKALEAALIALLGVLTARIDTTGH